MKSILKAFRDALVANAALILIVPTSNIYAGVRDQRTGFPAIDIFTLNAGTTPLHGSKTGGMSIANTVYQISIFSESEDLSLTISDLILDIILSDNMILNTAGIKNILQTGEQSLIDPSGLSHIPLEFSFQYFFKPA